MAEPLLSLMFISDIVKTTTLCKFIIYADDKILLTFGKILPQMIAKTNICIRAATKRLNTNRLTVDATKSHFFIIHRKQWTIELLSPILMSCGPLKRVQTTKFLGIIVDENLSWESHTKYMTRKLSNFVPIIAKLKGICSKKILKLIYNYLINSNIVYCNTAGGAFNTALATLQVIQKKIVLAMVGLK